MDTSLIGYAVRYSPTIVAGKYLLNNAKKLATTTGAAERLYSGGALYGGPVTGETKLAHTGKLVAGTAAVALLLALLLRVVRAPGGTFGR